MRYVLVFPSRSISVMSRFRPSWTAAPRLDGWNLPILLNLLRQTTMSPSVPPSYGNVPVRHVRSIIDPGVKCQPWAQGDVAILAH
jgi:hypothetical protein